MYSDFRFLLRALSLLLVIALGTGCASKIGLRNPAYAPIPAQPPVVLGKDNGAIYQEGMRAGLFADTQARNVGDILTINLVENTTATRSAATATAKENTISTEAPSVAGDEVTLNGRNLLENDVNASREFSGEGSSDRSSSLKGTITVTVAQVLPNNNLLVRGERLISVNGDNEFLRFTGIVRPQDVRPDNTVESGRVAHAQISFGGQGSINDANRIGWLGRFFQGDGWPF
ncbi:MAG TPA: flagellar basal body L-ring protein [Gammaproteobacteria bacterium]|nr:flagellar basal body L-ring protein [Gammaproteobacteria bacterium]